MEGIGRWGDKERKGRVKVEDKAPLTLNYSQRPIPNSPYLSTFGDMHVINVVATVVNLAGAENSILY